jgi:hypothetical protein
VCLVDDVDEEMGREGGRCSWGNFLLESFLNWVHIFYLPFHLLEYYNVWEGNHNSWYELGFPYGPFFLQLWEFLQTR